MDIRLLTELTTPAKVLLRDMLFDGADVIRCYEGRFRFTYDGVREEVLGPGDVLVSYPGHRVTIEALEPSNRLVYAILYGRGVEEYLDSLGYYDGLRGRAASQYESVMELKRTMETEAADKAAGRRLRQTYFTDILVTMMRGLRENSSPLVMDAVRLIRKNLDAGVVRLAPLCEQLGVSRSGLHRAFVAAGMGSPAELVRQEQLRRVLRALRETDRSIGEIAKSAGFISITHFANFMRRMTGKSASEWRRRLVGWGK